MAKKDKGSKADTKAKGKNKETETKTKEAAPEFEFGVEDIAKAMDLKPASVRVKLRNASIEKAGKSYGWDTKKEMQEVIDQISSDDSDEKPAKGKKAKAEEKPAKGKKAKGKKDKSDD